MPNPRRTSAAADRGDTKTSKKQGRGDRDLDEIDRRRRDADIVSRRIRRQSWNEIAAAHGISVRTCRDVWARYRQEADHELVSRDANEVVYETIEQVEWVKGELGQIATDADNSSAKVGALRAFMNALQLQFELMRDVGLLPRNLGQLRGERDVRAIFNIVLDVFDEYDMPEEARDKIDALVAQRRQPQPLTADEPNGSSATSSPA